MSAYTYWFCDSSGNFRTLESLNGSYQLVNRATHIEVWVLGVPEPDGSRLVLDEHVLHYGPIGRFCEVHPLSPAGKCLNAVTL